MKYDPLYIQFIHYFNHEQDYYECHEVLEELWLEEGRSLLYQGLLQVAVGLHHHSYGNISGSIKLFESGIQKLLHFMDADIGIDLADLLQKSKAYVAQLKGVNSALFEFTPFEIIVLDPVLQDAANALLSSE